MLGNKEGRPVIIGNNKKWEGKTGPKPGSAAHIEGRKAARKSA